MKTWLWRTIGILAFGSAVWMFCYFKALNPLNALREHYADATPSLSIQFRDVKLIGRSGGKMVWRLNSKFVNVSKDRAHVTFDGGMQGEMIEDDRTIGDVRADKVVYSTYSNDLFIPGTAEVKLRQGTSLEARHTYWNARRMTLVCDGGVDAVLDTGTVHGARMSVDLNNKEITVQRANGSLHEDSN